MSFTNVPITVINQIYSRSTKLDAFADTNALLEICDRNLRPFIHFWTTEEETLILGINDRHLPKLAAGLKSLLSNHYDYFLRNSGGLAVVSDPGILNISLFIPQPDTVYTIDQAYEIIKGLISMSFPQLDIKSFEVTNSYCPGKYDLSVNGQKIAGIAQRRTTNALVLMLYLSVNGDQDARSQTVAEFYETADAYSQSRWTFPKVDQTTMTTVQQLGFPDITPSDVEHKFLESVTQQNISVDLTSGSDFMLSREFTEERAKQLRKIQLRNDQLPIV
ncbi:lipoate--protein ligase [Lentilactobacillus otakiensis]|uniref:Biotin/lipoate A/B protein ligase n=1 Tax=Lentilactobacillus otakiensis DSM 19908 = JCM 15040 TaxID=1423780 RepID=S4NU91_9LACO|nr:biotin/lipoate A/B protein ligase [Lentilactobacillus otakiensis]KRL11827.1 biotin lipoate A B protein ligase [Lentilactobacillus otakiensis DSM 19908 = JCM 15040]MBZ3776052.1 lipoate--protein ligase [Lentilactobacillus otakiensis]MDV3519167.1 lipoate--protein ligase [Lentilactobacillus otakiensis]GAD17528.1 biotin/lipoate A/B protein ligase [Lentilactobacillus otakiensis DSM 19908 = JCM 15040]